MIKLPKGYRGRCDQVRGQLDTVRSKHMPIWRDLADYILPMRTRFVTDDKNRGDRRSQKIVDGTPIQAVRTLKAGMSSYVTPPTRPWFNLTTPDPDMADYGPVKDYLFNSAQALRDLFRECRDDGVTVAVARLESTRAQDAFERFDLYEVLQRDHVFHSVDEAVRALGGQT